MTWIQSGPPQAHLLEVWLPGDSFGRLNGVQMARPTVNHPRSAVHTAALELRGPVLQSVA